MRTPPTRSDPPPLSVQLSFSLSMGRGAGARHGRPTPVNGHRPVCFRPRLAGKSEHLSPRGGRPRPERDAPRQTTRLGRRPGRQPGFGTRRRKWRYRVPAVFARRQVTQGSMSRMPAGDGVVVCGTTRQRPAIRGGRRECCTRDSRGEGPSLRKQINGVATNPRALSSRPAEARQRSRSEVDLDFRGPTVGLSYRDHFVEAVARASRPPT